MKFTSNEIKGIERTMDKLLNVAHTMLDRESTDYVNARHLSYIVGEMRVCAELMASKDHKARLQGSARLTNLLVYNKA